MTFEKLSDDDYSGMGIMEPVISKWLASALRDKGAALVRFPCMGHGPTYGVVDLETNDFIFGSNANCGIYAAVTEAQRAFGISPPGDA